MNDFLLCTTYPKLHSNKSKTTLEFYVRVQFRIGICSNKNDFKTTIKTTNNHLDPYQFLALELCT